MIMIGETEVNTGARVGVMLQWVEQDKIHVDMIMGGEKVGNGTEIEKWYACRGREEGLVLLWVEGEWQFQCHGVVVNVNLISAVAHYCRDGQHKTYILSSFLMQELTSTLLLS